MKITGSIQRLGVASALAVSLAAVGGQALANPVRQPASTAGVTMATTSRTAPVDVKAMREEKMVRRNRQERRVEFRFLGTSI
jgi:hypothetical protein